MDEETGESPDIDRESMTLYDWRIDIYQNNNFTRVAEGPWYWSYKSIITDGPLSSFLKKLGPMKKWSNQSSVPHNMVH